MDDTKPKQYYCEKCNKTMGPEQFYSSNNLEKYPNDGKFPVCKKCMTMHVDNWNPDTYLWIMQEADVPYIPEEWNKLMASYARDKKKVTGSTIIGRYLSKMKLNQYRKYRWKDTEFLKNLAASRREQVMRDQGYDEQQITLANDRAEFAVPEEIEVPDLAPDPAQTLYQAGPAETYDDSAADIDLTEEDRTYLRLKWGKMYRPEEWVWLEQLFNDMMESYDIQTAGHLDNLKLLCKTSLKCNQLIDAADIEGYQKMSKVYDSLMKSGKFSAAQNKADNGDAIDSVGELVALCETDGFIPRFYVDKPNDKVDQTLIDMKRYTKTLITEETNLGNLIEEAIKNNQKEDEADKLLTEDGNLSDEDLIGDLESQIKDNDYQDYNDFLEEEEINDANLLNFLSQEGSE